MSGNVLLKKKAIIVSIAIVLVIGIGLSAWFVHRTYSRESAPIPNESDIASIEINTVKFPGDFNYIVTSEFKDLLDAFKPNRKVRWEYKSEIMGYFDITKKDGQKIGISLMYHDTPKVVFAMENGYTHDYYIGGDVKKLKSALLGLKASNPVHEVPAGH